MPDVDRVRTGRRLAPAAGDGQWAAAPGAPAGRQAARENMLERIRVSAHVHLASEGAAGLSMRAVARDLGVVSSAIYRYVPSRDALLRLLMADATASLSVAVTEAEAAVRRGDLKGRFTAAARALRSWALASPSAHSLIASRPVPGFEPEPGIGGPVAAVPAVLIRILDDASARSGPGEAALRLPAGVRRDLAAVRRETGVSGSEDLVARGLLVWAALTGAVSLEVSGQLAGVTTDPAAWFGHEVDRLARYAGLT